MSSRTGGGTHGRLTLAFLRTSPGVLSVHPRKLATSVACLSAIVLAIGCASTKVANREELVTGQIPRPNMIWVYNFAATAADVPANSALAGVSAANATDQSAQDIAIGQQLGSQIASELVKQIQGMGMPAAVADAATVPQINDIVIRGYLVSIQQGSEAKRMIIGFGSGASELKTAVEGYQMTAHGLRKLGFGTVNAGGGKTPGAALGVVGLIATANPAGLIVSTGMKVYGEASGKSKVQGRAASTAKEIADVLKKRFQEQGWIN